MAACVPREGTTWTSAAAQAAHLAASSMDGCRLTGASSSKMMMILEKKFGTKNLIINNIIGQLQKMKVVTPDKMLIELVKKLQKMKLDLDSLKQ